MQRSKLSSKDYCPFIRVVFSKEIARYTDWTWQQRLRWTEHWARIYHNSTTREERIAHYRLKAGENVKYYDAYGWPEHF